MSVSQARYDPESEQPGSGRAYPRDAQFPDPRRGQRFQPSLGGYPNQQGAVRDDAHWRAPNRHPQPHPTQWEPQVATLTISNGGCVQLVNCVACSLTGKQSLLSSSFD